MNNNEVLKYIEFAHRYNHQLSIIGVTGKTSEIYVDDYDETQLTGRFAATAKEMNYKYENIVSCHFSDDRNQCEFAFISNFEDSDEIYNRIATLKTYYKGIINSEDVDTKDNDSEYTQKKKTETYHNMFEHIYDDPNGLFAQYVLSKPTNTLSIEDSVPILLMSQSNFSQKNAIETSLKNRVSVIEGPPGTGKTTTILSIIANLIVRKKKVVIISKNNSAIDNVKEELEKLNLPSFYLRLGNKDIQKELNETLKSDSINTMSEMDKLGGSKDNLSELTGLYNELKEREEALNTFLTMENELREDENQLRHLQKRQAAIKPSLPDSLITKHKVLPISRLLKEIDKIANGLQQIDYKGKLSLWSRLRNRIILGMDTQKFSEYGLSLQLELEQLYLEKKIEMQTDELAEKELEKEQQELKNIYDSVYIRSSLQFLNTHLYKFSRSEKYKSAIDKITSYAGENITYDMLDSIREVYPLILTTADSLIYNFSSMIKSGEKFDYIIMDEASQCDLIAGLPMLSLGGNAVIVGDEKQLSAIRNEPDTTLPDVDVNHDYYLQTFLDSTKKVWNITPTLLKEHYRCDYSIINFCNKFYYDNELIIYTNANEGAMQMIPVSKGKYVDTEDNSFYNDREIKALSERTSKELKSTFIITPFKKQGEHLRQYFQCDKETCGTIHSFQGREEATVYFSTVLNDIASANNHLKNDHCLFTRELLNVAVSRAKTQFVLVSDVSYFIKKNKMIADLANYIETYGEVIPDKTICIFDNLCKLMKSYTKTDDLDNPFEEAVHTWLEKYLEKQPQLYHRLKLPLTYLVSDEEYLSNNPDIKSYILSPKAHLDFTIFNKIGNPLLVIELDGKYHKGNVQMNRDKKKNDVLEHVGIPLWRLKSKDALTFQDFDSELRRRLGINIE